MPTLIHMYTHTHARTHARTHTHTHTRTNRVGEVHPKYVFSRNNVAAFLWFVTVCPLLNSSAVPGQIPDLFLPSLQVNAEQLGF